MPRKIPDALIDHACNLHASGMTLVEISRAIKVNADLISRRLRAMGIDTSTGKGTGSIKRAISLDAEHIKSMYQQGESENAIAKKFGVSRAVIRKHLLASNEVIRSQSETEKIKWSKATPEQRKKQVEAAHVSARGRIVGIDELRERAQAKYRMPYDALFGIGEAEFREYLLNIGLQFESQFPVDSYNIDFLIGNIAVELTTDRSRTNPKFANRKRIEYLRDRGIKTLYVHIDCADTVAHFARDIVAYAKLIDSGNVPNADYWVIWCRLQNYIIIKNKLNQFTRVEAPVEFHNRRAACNFC